MHFMYLESEGVCIESLGVGMRTEKLRAFHANGSITKGCAFGGAGNDTDMIRHTTDIANIRSVIQFAASA